MGDALRDRFSDAGSIPAWSIAMQNRLITSRFFAALFENGIDPLMLFRYNGRGVMTTKGSNTGCASFILDRSVR